MKVSIHNNSLQIVLLLTLFLLFSLSQAEQIISLELQNRLKNAKVNEKFRVFVIMKDQVDIEDLSNALTVSKKN